MCVRSPAPTTVSRAPFVYEELLARIHALLRRCPPRIELTEVGPLAIDRAARRVAVGGAEVELSAKEYALLVKLASAPDRVFTREQLLRDVWGVGYKLRHVPAG